MLRLAISAAFVGVLFIIGGVQGGRDAPTEFVIAAIILTISFFAGRRYLRR